MKDYSENRRFYCSNYFFQGTSYIKIISQECLESKNKVVFMISTLLSGHMTKYIQRIIVNSDFNHCVLLSILLREVNNFISIHSDVFQYMAQQIRTWMKNEVGPIVVVVCLFVCLFVCF